jgi:sulfite reductase (NADPH) flavoprotein alpha-component
MNSVPIIPENAPFTADQRAWLNGFLAGVLSRGQETGQTSQVKEPLLVAFGSQSGNAESLAKKLAKEANTAGFQARACGLENINPADLPKEKNVLVITSTWGEGEMPDNAATFWSGMNRNGSSPNLSGVKYSVLALGDLNYGETFCQAGRMIDERLEALGALRVFPRVDCDVDFDEAAKAWSDGALKSFRHDAQTPALSAGTKEVSLPKVESGYHKGNPFPAPLVRNVKLNGAGSAKDTRHLAFSLAGSGLVYETGDALGVRVKNCPEVVAQVMEAHGFDGTESVTLPKLGEMSLDEALAQHFEIRGLLGKRPETRVPVQEWVGSLRKLNPRLYSIASSQKANPDEVHLCVGVVRYEVDGIGHQGVASTYLAERCVEAGVFVHAAKHFRVPADGNLPIIMVGPGTGIAPFRAFLQERQVTGARGRNWLFFGDQYRASDYLYEEEIEAWKADGFLTRLDLAFSRDQSEKVYVQQRMLESGGELWKWLDEGAHFYVCGDASRMAKDVDAALHNIVARHGGRSEEEAAAYVAEMKKSRRYARDVY